jgi:hypothetical protein
MVWIALICGSIPIDLGLF